MIFFDISFWDNEKLIIKLFEYRREFYNHAGKY
jgi:hypothetical protein